MKTYKIVATANAQFNGVIKAKTKKEAEEKFRAKCSSGEILPDHIELQEIIIDETAFSEPESSGQVLPVEIWDRMDRYDYYAKLGYDVAKAEPSKGKYLYSRKGKMIDEYVRRLERMTADECVKEYCPKNKILGTGDRNKIREILIQSIIDDAKQYALAMNAEFNEERIRRNAERVISGMPKTIDKIIAEDKKKINNFFQKQGIKLPKNALGAARMKANQKKKKKSV